MKVNKQCGGRLLFVLELRVRNPADSREGRVVFNLL